MLMIHNIESPTKSVVFQYRCLACNIFTTEKGMDEHCIRKHGFTRTPETVVVNG